MRIERANLAKCIKIAMHASDDIDAEAAGNGGPPYKYMSIQTRQIVDLLTAIENGEQLEIV